MVKAGLALRSPANLVLPKPENGPLLYGKGHQCHDPGLLDSLSQKTLVLGTVPRDPPREYLASFSDIPAEARDVLIIDIRHTVNAKRADALLSFTTAFSPQRKDLLQSMQGSYCGSPELSSSSSMNVSSDPSLFGLGVKNWMLSATTSKTFLF